MIEVPSESCEMLFADLLLLAWLRKAPESRRSRSPSYYGPAWAHANCISRLLISSNSHPRLSILDSLSSSSPSPSPDRHIRQAPRDKFTVRLYIWKCFGIYEMLYRWEVILIKNLICAFVYFFGHKWIPEKFFGKGKKQLTRSQVILTARTRVAINNQLLRQSFCSCHADHYHLKKALICEPHHMTICDSMWYSSVPVTKIIA